MKSSLSLHHHRTDWFRDARFGMFIHWGLYALIGHGEWVMNRERIPLARYRKLASRFTASEYDPAAWASAARSAGMKYMVLTTKHHEMKGSASGIPVPAHIMPSTRRRGGTLSGSMLTHAERPVSESGSTIRWATGTIPTGPQGSTATARHVSGSWITRMLLSRRLCPGTGGSTCCSTICRRAIPPKNGRPWS